MVELWTGKQVVKHSMYHRQWNVQDRCRLHVPREQVVFDEHVHHAVLQRPLTVGHFGHVAGYVPRQTALRRQHAWPMGGQMCLRDRQPDIDRVRVNCLRAAK